ncbi:hypothetical protein ACIQJX_05275 [Streptomyces griseoviridis]|uniref:hypothetical protein n=1 Tax=Streptomyces sp. MAA16 TaxID=3035116 RepID=UPI002477164F|nr:hypothetical protein [Streptomyces sp. MAA16]MDH6698255.1 hypothetical protein [Streptomyces sp. MAA16]
MRSRLAARSTRLVLAAAAVTALAATTTACDPQDAADASGSTSPSATASTSGDTSTADPSAGASTGGSGSDGSSSTASNGSSGSGTSGSSGSSGGSGSGSGDKSGYGQSCGTNDLTFSVSSESQAGGYFLVTARAKAGITCYLDVNTPSVSFGSDASGVASPVGQGGEDPIKLSGSAVAYTGVNPKSTNSDGGREFDFLIIATSEEDADPAEVKLPEAAAVEKPLVTNWTTRRAEAVPVAV